MGKAFDLEKSFIDADAVLILTEWDNYKHLTGTRSQS